MIGECESHGDAQFTDFKNTVLCGTRVCNIKLLFSQISEYFAVRTIHVYYRLIEMDGLTPVDENLINRLINYIGGSFKSNGALK